MKITAVSVGTRGDIQPLMELGIEMIRRGHDFRVAGLEKFRGLAEEKRVPFIHLDGDADRVMQLLVTDYVHDLDFVSGCKRLYRETPGFMASLLEAVRGSDAVMYGTLSGFARHVCDLLQIPCIRYFYSPFDRTDQYSLYSTDHNKPSVGRSYQMIEPGMNLLTCRLVNGWRQEHGLKKWTMWEDYREQDGKKVLTFYPVTPIFMPPDPKWGSHIHVTGYWYHPEEEAAAYTPEPALARFLRQGRKPVFICFGKAESPALARLQHLVLETVKELQLRAVIQADQITGPERTNSDLLYFVDSIPYSWMFRQVEAVIHHGGNTTNGIAMWAGCPALVIPLALDQYFYGRAIQENGCGPAPLYIRKKMCTQKELKAAMQDLVSGRYEKKAAELAARIRKEDGCRQAADIIEQHFA